ncbi:hypothetical protein HK100_011056 [Physocladia obscura]|uniref:Serine aminopeptidase S33 domain-containing protein n=1 Tax=Physocladia obscura TaxID=109957 RepID=A0AAD5XIK5_9FUNG|nr:hypothetical protein HK100_011056 [Physocladia obscura]
MDGSLLSNQSLMLATGRTVSILRRPALRTAIIHANPEHMLNPNPICLVLVNGFKSTFTESRKTRFFITFCERANIDFATFDHAGHGPNPSVSFGECTLPMWKDDLNALINDPNFVGSENSKVVLVACSMGLHLSLLCAQSNPRKICGIVGVGGACNFHSFVSGFYANSQVSDNVWMRESRYDPAGYPIYRKFIKSISECAINETTFCVDCPVVLVHGMQDEEVPFNDAIKVAQFITTKDVQVLLLKNGDHRLSSEQELAAIESEVQAMISKIGV